MPLRVLALPISIRQSTKSLYCFYPLSHHVKTSQTQSKFSPSSSQNIDDENDPKNLPLTIRTALPKVIDWSSTKWDELSLSKQDTWKYKTWVYGEKLMDRIEFEEWNLKSIDPNFKPRKKETTSTSTSTQSDKSTSSTSTSSTPSSSGQKVKTYPLLYPSSLVNETQVMENFQNFLNVRSPYHRRQMFICIISSPLTIPFMIVPIIPNLPFFFLMWRAWSHWRSWKSSEYLIKLVNSKSIIPTPSAQLDDAYKSSILSSSSSSDQQEKSSNSLLTAECADRIVQTFDLNSKGSLDLFRAVHQSEAKLSKDGQERKDQ